MAQREDQKIKDRLEVTYRRRIGPGDKVGKDMRIWNRIVSWTDEGIRPEGDQRHVEIALNVLQLSKDSKGVVTPVEKTELKGEENKKMTASGKRKFRGLVARMKYL